MTTHHDAYDPLAHEPGCYEAWETAGAFAAGHQTDAPGHFSIMLPPPNVTGQLHMGHGFQQTLMDILVRYHRMRGENVLWQPGTDHAGIATQLLVEKQLQRTGLSKEKLGRDAFIERIMHWKNHSGQTITQQMRRLGASCDWSRECFTLDPDMNHIVNHVFVRLYQDQLIYKGVRLVNWDPVLRTAVSDLEVINTERQGRLVFMYYPIVGHNERLCVATTRPETLFGDTAVAVHPDDTRWSHYIGQRVQLPLTNRTIPIIADSSVDPLFGTGCVKVTPAHDFNDYAIGQRHELPSITILDEAGRLNRVTPAAFQGLSVEDAREEVITALKAQQLIADIRTHLHMVPVGERSGAVIEPRLTPQWFMDLTTRGRTAIIEPALALVEQGHIRFVPEHWTDTYYRWMHNIQDWCLSRQLWWGHQIPAWYTDKGDVFVACDEASATAQAIKAGYEGPLTRDPDVLDTWFSSALWPFSTLQWTPEYPQQTNPFLTHYLPSSVLVTGFDIIFFWVSRMIMMTKYITGQPAFREVYIHGLIRDAEGQKMSKSKGNILDPLDVVQGISAADLLAKRTQHLLLDTQKKHITQQTQREFPNGISAHGADALRFTFASLASPGRDIKFDMQRCTGYHYFCNKLWHAARFVMMTVQTTQDRCENDINDDNSMDYHPADLWLAQRYEDTAERIATNLQNYRFDWASEALYHFIWDEWCAWGLEIAKIHAADPQWKESTKQALVLLLNAVLHLAHPFLPFLTEQLWQMLHTHLNKTPPTTFLMLSQQPTLSWPTDPTQWMTRCQHWIGQVRQLRTAHHCKPTDWVSLEVCSTQDPATITQWAPYLKGLARIRDITFVDTLSSETERYIDDHTRIGLNIAIDYEAEYAQCQHTEQKLQSDLGRLSAKLNNPSFIDKAPTAIVEQTQALYARKCADLQILQHRMRTLSEKLSSCE